jgi:hypothetical protein
MERKLNLKFWLVGAFLLAISPSVTHAQTLGSIKEKYLNKRVIVGGPVINPQSQGPVLLDWYAATAEPDGSYKGDVLNLNNSRIP